MVHTVSRILQVYPAGARVPTEQRDTYRTVTAALAQASAGTLIRLQPGRYTQPAGEHFPLVVPAGVIVVGNEADTEQTIQIEGGSAYQDTQGKFDSVAMVLQADAQLRGVTLSNPQGYGLGLMAGRALVRAVQVKNCRQAGVMVSQQASPTMLKTTVEGVQGSGVCFRDLTKGEVRDCQIKQCQTGIAIEEEASPLIISTSCFNNDVGIRVSGSARPVLRQNQIAQNRTLGLWLQGNAQPDLGQPQNPGENLIRYNATFALRNDTAQEIPLVGNDVLPQQMKGPLRLVASEVPDQAAVPSSLIGQERPTGQETPASEAPEKPATAPPAQTGPTSQPFQDMTGHWAAPYVVGLVAKEAITGFGDGTFRPDQTVTRAQFAALVTATFPEQPIRENTVAFKDVPDTLWAKSAITLAQRQGFLGGFPDGTFRPNDPMIRAQAMVAIANGLGLAPAPASTLTLYKDRAQIPSYAVDAIAAATQHRLIVNYPDPLILRPLEPITRAEVATLAYQGLVLQGEASLIRDDQVVRPDTTLATFPDIQNHWAEPFIQGLLDQSLMRGFEDGSFRPDRPISRAQYAALVNNAFSPPAVRTTSAFVDVPQTHWAAQAIMAVCRGGFMAGFPDHTFNPDGALLRVQAWVSLVNGLGLGMDHPAPSALLGQFRDAGTLPSYALDPVSRAVEASIVVNYPNPQLLHPHRVASRADISATVYQALVARKRLSPIGSEFVV